MVKEKLYGVSHTVSVYIMSSIGLGKCEATLCFPLFYFLIPHFLIYQAWDSRERENWNPKELHFGDVQLSKKTWGEME